MGKPRAKSVFTICPLQGRRFSAGFSYPAFFIVIENVSCHPKLSVTTGLLLRLAIQYATLPQSTVSAQSAVQCGATCCQVAPIWFSAKKAFIAQVLGLKSAIHNKGVGMASIGQIKPAKKMSGIELTRTTKVTSSRRGNK